VWSYNGDKASPVPPPQGWKVPWDGAVDDSLRLAAASSRDGPSHKRPGESAGDYPPPKHSRQQHHDEDSADDKDRGGRRRVSEEEDHRRQERRRFEEDDRRRREDDDRRRREQQQREREERQREEQKREEERRRREEEERQRQHQRREEEERRRQEEAKRRREEEELRRREQTAAQAVRKVIGRLREATPETLEEICAELKDVQEKEYNNMGTLAQKVSTDAENAVREGKRRVEETIERRKREEERRQREEQRRQEEEEKMSQLLSEGEEQVKAAEEKVERAATAVKPIEGAATEEPESILHIAAEVEELVARAKELLESTGNTLTETRHETSEFSNSARARKEIGEFQRRLSEARRTIDQVSSDAKEARVKAVRKSAAMKKDEVQKEQFQRHDTDKDGKLSEAEVLALAKAEYDFVVPTNTLEKIRRYLEPITFNKFLRLRHMVAIAKTECLARARRAAEEERLRLLEEKKEAVQKMFDEAEELASTSETSSRRTEDEAEALTNRSSDSLDAQKMRDIADSTDTLMQLVEQDLARFQERIAEIAEKCADDDDLYSFQKYSLPKLQHRHSKTQGHVEKVAELIKDSREKAAKKEYAELAQQQQDAVTALRSYMGAEGKTGEQLFEVLLNGAGSGAVEKARFVEFVAKELKEPLQLTEPQVEKLFDHIAGGEETTNLSKARFLELIRLYYKCVKATVMTEGVSIKSKTVRRLLAGEVLEALEGPQNEEGAKVMRVKCLSVEDGTVGFVTVAGNQGTPFLVPGGNVYAVVRETVMTDGVSVAESKTVRRLAKGELIEVVEFGKLDETLGVKRLKGKAKLDGALGWITLEGNQGTAFLELA